MLHVHACVRVWCLGVGGGGGGVQHFSDKQKIS